MARIRKACGIAGKKKHGSPGRAHRRNHKNSTNVGKRNK